MSSTFSTNKVLEKQATGENENTWGTNLNTALDAIDACFGRTSLSVAGSADVTLTTAQARPIIQEYTGVLTGNINVIVPTLPAVYIVYNNTTGSFTLTVKTSGGTGIAVTQATRTIVYCDGTNVVSVLSTSSYLSTTGGTLTGAINGATIATVASATTCDIGAAASNAVSITGTTTITGFGTITSGTMRFIRFTGILTLTHNATSLILPGGANITTAAGDCAIAQSLGSGNWAVLHYQRATGSAINEAKGADIASATTTDIGAATGNYVVVTGTTTITGLGTVQAGTRRIVEFSGALTLTHNATSLILPGAANITTAAGDCATFISEGSGNWRCVSYLKANGTPIAGSVPVGSIVSYGGTSAPSGWLLCYGQNVSRSTYSALFAIVGTAFGSGDGSTTFGIPDLRGRAAFGKDDMGGSAANRVTNAVSGITGTTLGSAGGSQSLTAHTHTFSKNSGTGISPGASGQGGALSSDTTGSTGSGSSENMPPALIVNKIIFAGA